MKRPLVHFKLSSNLFLTTALCLITILVVPGMGRAESVRRDLITLDPSFRESVLRGWRYFHTSFADDGVACVHCHRDHSDIVTWAGSYPKVHIFDQTPYQVKTLRTVIIEAMDRHTDLGPTECREMAEDLHAYIAWWGDGQPLVPGSSTKGIPPEEDVAELGRSVVRGRDLFNREKPRSCDYCHTVEASNDNYRSSLKDIFLGFPRSSGTGERPVSLDSYLLAHYKRQGVVMSARSITDIASFLAQLSHGKLLRPGALKSGEESLP